MSLGLDYLIYFNFVKKSHFSQFPYWPLNTKLSTRKNANVALQSNLDKSARSKLDRSGSWEMEDYERERTVFGRAMEEGEVAV